MYKLVIFDLDGTLLDSDSMVVHTFIDLYKNLTPNKEIPSIEYMLGRFSGPPITDTLHHEFPGFDVDFLYKEYRRVSEKYDYTLKIFNSGIDMLENLSHKGIKLSVCTSKNDVPTLRTFKIVGIEKYFPYYITFEDVSNPKPDPEGIFKIMKYYGITDKKEVIYVGDGQRDYDTAINAGVDFCFCNWSPRVIDYYDKKPNLIIDDFDDLTEVIK